MVARSYRYEWQSSVSHFWCLGFSLGSIGVRNVGKIKYEIYQTIFKTPKI